MNKTLLMLVLVGAAAGCSKSADTSNKESATALAADNLSFITVDDVDTQITKGTAQAVDANGNATRKHEGVVPGAVLLTSFDGYALTELPSDKTKELVFYCMNTHCAASHQAAEKAIASGYTNVKVMPEGIAGWIKAGKKVQNI